jgi:hypothetical protein
MSSIDSTGSAAPPRQHVAQGVPARGIACALLGAAAANAAFADNLLGLYVGGAAGESRVEADSGGYTTGSFKANHSAFKVMLGVRPISLVGVEVSYIDFGHPEGSLGGESADVNLTGAAAFAIVYLPIPLIDVYGKLGLARLQSTVNGGTDEQTGNQISCIPCHSGLFRLERTDTHIAGGAGVQYKLSSLAVRAEYELFSNGGGTNPSLVSLGLTWSF